MTQLSYLPNKKMLQFAMANLVLCMRTLCIFFARSLSQFCNVFHVVIRRRWCFGALVEVNVVLPKPIWANHVLQ